MTTENSVRPFEWRDLPVLHRYRNECVYLDSSLMLTRGPIFVPTGAILSTLAHATGLFTFISEGDQANGVRDEYGPLIGQAAHVNYRHSARLTFFLPAPALQAHPASAVIEAILPVIGERGALHLLAEVDDQSPTTIDLRQAGFGIYARQRIWRLSASANRRSLPGGWRSAVKSDEAAIRFLYANLVPGLVQQVESLPTGRLRGLVYYRGVELLAYVDLEYGLSGIMAQPFIHPDAESVIDNLVSLLNNLPDLYSRPVFVRVRSYQSWLETVLSRHGAESILQQAVMVRHLAITRRVTQSLAVSVMNGSTPETSLPVAQIKTE